MRTNHIHIADVAICFLFYVIVLLPSIVLADRSTVCFKDKEAVTRRFDLNTEVAIESLLSALNTAQEKLDPAFEKVNLIYSVEEAVLERTEAEKVDAVKRITEAAKEAGVPPDSDEVKAIVLKATGKETIDDRSK